LKKNKDKGSNILEEWDIHYVVWRRINCLS